MSFITQESLYFNFEDSLVKLSEKSFMQDYFLVGCEVDNQELLFTRLIYQLSNSENCSIAKYIKDRVEKTEFILQKEIKKRRKRGEHCGDENENCEIKTIAINEW